MRLTADLDVRRGDFELRAAFELAAGTATALLGPNGAGKSTLVGALAGLVRPSRGRIELDGAVLDDTAGGIHRPPQERPIGVMFQGLLLFPHLSAVENAAFPLRSRGVPRAEARARARELLDQLGVGARAGARPAELSGGEAQRVALARALIARPRLLLLDEPLAALDVQARGQVRSLLRDVLAEFDGLAVLVTHDPVDAMTLCRHLVLLEGGRVTQEGTPEAIRRAPRTAYAAELVGLNLFTGRLEPLEPGAGRLVTADGELVVGWPGDAMEAGAAVIGLLRPADVVLHTARPAPSSARNVLPGAVQAIGIEGERARVRLASSPPLVAEITLGSLARLGLVEGAPVWATFKAVEVRLVKDR
jgi:molybdate transport system ATP-binding protein